MYSRNGMYTEIAIEIDRIQQCRVPHHGDSVTSQRLSEGSMTRLGLRSNYRYNSIEVIAREDVQPKSQSHRSGAVRVLPGKIRPRG
jgi:hypothetical protein